MLCEVIDYVKLRSLLSLLSLIFLSCLVIYYT